MFASIAEAKAAVGSSQFPGLYTLLSRLVYQSSDGNPQSTGTTPAFIGQHCLDTANSYWYMATGDDSSTWIRIG